MDRRIDRPNIARSFSTFSRVLLRSNVRKRLAQGKMSKVYTAEEVRKHDSERDLWIVYKDGVYDITKFLKEHPGGEEVLLALGGKDATTCFDDIGHTLEAVQLRETYKIGTLTGTLSAESTTNSAGIQDTTIDDDNWEYVEQKTETSRWLPVMIIIAVAVYSFIFSYFHFSVKAAEQ